MLVWDLRCEIREKLIAFVQQTFPESLRGFARRSTLDRQTSSRLWRRAWRDNEVD
jgi:hypothetical protein